MEIDKFNYDIINHVTHNLNPVLIILGLLQSDGTRWHLHLWNFNWMVVGRENN